MSSYAEAIKDRHQQMRGDVVKLQGQPRPSTLRYTVSEHVKALQMKRPPGAITQVIIEKAFPPCKYSLIELERIPVNELRLETHHHGRVLFARRFTEVAKGLCVLACGVEDEAGDAELLLFESFNLPSENDLPHQIIAIKEPYLKVVDCGTRTAAISVSHPSDILCLHPNDSRVPAALRTPDPKPAEICKNEGIHAFAQKKLVQALESFTSGIFSSQVDGSIKADLHRNRALLNIKLRRFQSAKVDALAALTSSGNNLLDCKALYRAALASYELRQFEEAESLCKEILKLSPDYADAKSGLERVRQRLAEQTTGAYDIAALSDQYKTGTRRLDAASFLGKTEVRQSPIAGRGLFAIEAIKAGNLVLCEKAVMCIFTPESNAYNAQFLDLRTDKSYGCVWGARYRELAKALFYNPDLVESVCKLQGHGYQPIPEVGKIVDGQPILDVFHLHDILENNGHGFQLPESGLCDSLEAPAGTVDIRAACGMGLWARASTANHSCVPNTTRSHLGDLLILRATKDIAADEEITITYTYEKEAAQKKEILADDYGFECQCPVCK